MSASDFVSVLRGKASDVMFKKYGKICVVYGDIIEDVKKQGNFYLELICYSVDYDTANAISSDSLAKRIVFNKKVRVNDWDFSNHNKLQTSLNAIVSELQKALKTK